MLYLDSANATSISRMLSTGVFHGVTTNPLVLAKAGLGSADLAGLVELSRDCGAVTFFAQATGTTVDEVRRSAAGIAEIGADVVVKVVCTEVGLTVATELATQGVSTLITAVYHPAQMALASAAGAAFVAPYLGRADDAGRSSIALVHDCVAIAGNGGPRVLAASMRSVDHVAAALVAGAHDVTVGDVVALALLSDDLTVAAADEFERIAGVAVTASR